MSNQAEVAQRLESIVGDILLDYFTVYLPVQLLVVDIIGLERRSVPAPTEFCLRAIDAGLGTSSEICGFLGLDLEYGERMLADLCDHDYIAKTAFSTYQLMRRGSEALKQESESSPSDRRMQVLWDPVQSAILDRTTVYTKQRIDSDGIIAPISNAFAQPSPSRLEIRELNKLRNSSSGSETASIKFDILRVTAIQKSFARYRPCLALVFKNQDGDLTLRIATNGSIDEDLTASCAKIGLSKLIGVDRRMGTRAGVQAIQKRRQNLQCGDAGDQNILQLTQKRSLLRLKIQGFERRLAEEYIESLEAKRAENQKELETIESQLIQLPVVPVRCHEVDYYLIEAFKNAKSTITITSTIPSALKMDGQIMGHLRSCLFNKVAVTFYVADRLGDNDATLANLEKLSRNGSLKVEFLQNSQRAVFEVEWDGNHLLFCNEPPLGSRRLPISPREFAGYFVSDEKAVSIYRRDFLSFNRDDFLVRLRPLKSPIGGLKEHHHSKIKRKNRH
ncbi:hypothetical protein [Achromobacter xylosoxidans]|uniref:hypothetical protein n=1 Tax=Alcaligenes xylosoxydans xylosoxydans TaxID=85698 RepID=UPI001F12AF82|nr:hypothetical protein [Achromobacter xylosoxidans]